MKLDKKQVGKLEALIGRNKSRKLSKMREFSGSAKGPGAGDLEVAALDLTVKDDQASFQSKKPNSSD